MTRKAIRLQFDLTYSVPEELLEEMLRRDVTFFNEIGESIQGWGTDPNNPRQPINFEFRHHTGDVEGEQDDEEE